MQDKVLFENQFLSVIERKGYFFVRSTRSQGIKVSLLPFHKESKTSALKFLARLELCPAHGPQLEYCSITGGLVPGKTVEETACQETWEEAGYFVKESELISLGTVRPSKEMDTLVHLFAIDVTGKEQSTPPGDGSTLEAIASIEWVNYEKGIQINDPLFVTAITRLLAL
jgi:8-oxo-dGTP pyrophosphatase MutT (NUDIX family)